MIRWSRQFACIWLAVWSFLALCLFVQFADAQDTELDVCLPDSNACSETEAVTIDDFCGNSYYFYHGRLSWPPLRAVGPITVSVRTWGGDDAMFPLFIEIVKLQEDSLTCSTSGNQLTTVLDARGSGQCGGTWESIGPLDPDDLLVPLGSLYRIRVSFIQFTRTLPFPRSPALGCIRVTTNVGNSAPIAGATWSGVKTLYK